MASNDTVSVRAPEPPKSTTPMRVTSTSFSEGAKIPMEHVHEWCGGKNKSPQLSWSGAPEGTKSFAITCFDPDAPTGSGYWHWIAFNIPAKVTSLDAGTDDKPGGGVGGRSDFGATSYGGPCPPQGHGDHHYTFTVYALDVDKIEGANGETTGASTVFMMRGHVLATGKITGVFGH